MKSEDDNMSDATIIHASFDGEKDVETIEGMQPTLYHVNRETNEIGDIHLNSAFVCEENSTYSRRRCEDTSKKWNKCSYK